VPRTPKAFRPKAQGWRSCAYPGSHSQDLFPRANAHLQPVKTRKPAGGTSPHPRMPFGLCYIHLPGVEGRAS
jgi:hypothetical protein